MISILKNMKLTLCGVQRINNPSYFSYFAPVHATSR